MNITTQNTEAEMLEMFNHLTGQLRFSDERAKKEIGYEFDCDVTSLSFLRSDTDEE